MTTARKRRASTKTQPDAPAPATDSAAAPLEFEWLPYSRLQPWPGNPKSYSDDEVQDVVASVKRFGWGRPLIANRHKGLEGEIIIGHRAQLAAQKLGPEFQARDAPGPGLVPVVWKSLPGKVAHGLSLADNQLGKKETDETKLKGVVRSDELDPMDWMSAGFTEKEVRALMFDPWPDERKRSDDGGPKLEQKFQVVIDCTSEDHQTQLLDWAQEQGLKCRALI